MGLKGLNGAKWGYTVINRASSLNGVKRAKTGFTRIDRGLRASKQGKTFSFTATCNDWDIAIMPQLAYRGTTCTNIL